MTPIADRFMRYVDKGGPNGCWLWTGAKRAHGYGAMMMGSRRDGTKRAEQAHRVSYELHSQSNISYILSGKRWKRLQAASGDGATL